jgi:uncharacterized membrane protein
MKKFFKTQFSSFLFGFVFWLPILIVILVLVYIFNNIEDIGKKVLLFFLPDRYFHEGFGIAFSLLVIYFSGIILRLPRVKRLLSRIPILGRFLGGGEVISIERLLHLCPCIFLMSPSCMSYGWILSEEKVKISGEKAVFTLINVYYPNVPSLITGQVFPVRKSTVIKLANPSKEIIDLLLYSFRSPKDLIYIPWEDESTEEFEKRAKSFGLDVN